MGADSDLSGYVFIGMFSLCFLPAICAFIKATWSIANDTH